MCARYKVSVINTWPGGASTGYTQQRRTSMTTHNGQFMMVFFGINAK